MPPRSLLRRGLRPAKCRSGRSRRPAPRPNRWARRYRASRTLSWRGGSGCFWERCPWPGWWSSSASARSSSGPIDAPARSNRTPASKHTRQQFNNTTRNGAFYTSFPAARKRHFGFASVRTRTTGSLTKRNTELDSMTATSASQVPKCAARKTCAIPFFSDLHARILRAGNEYEAAGE